jgi:hypothetical protein
MPFPPAEVDLGDRREGRSLRLRVVRKYRDAGWGDFNDRNGKCEEDRD